MVVIQVHVGKQLMDDMLLEREFKVNIITKDLRKKLGLLVPKPTPYILKMAYQTLTKLIGLIKEPKNPHSWFCLHCYFYNNEQ